MTLPLMPKGVEHPTPPHSAGSLHSVTLPLMPKGVEHCGLVELDGRDIEVTLPLMPKGVEHILPRRNLPVRHGDPSVDAERR